jgi:hypothetical protein
MPPKKKKPASTRRINAKQYVLKNKMVRSIRKRAKCKKIVSSGCSGITIGGCMRGKKAVKHRVTSFCRRTHRKKNF